MLHTTKTILAIMITLTLAGAGALWWFVSHINQASQELALTIETIANEEEVTRDQKILSTLLESTADERAQLESRIIQGESGTIEFLSEIDSFAAAENITLITSSLAVAPEARKPYDSLDISYEVSGSETAIKKFLALLETIPYESEVTQLSFTRSVDAVTGLRQANANVAIRISMTNL